MGKLSIASVTTAQQRYPRIANYVAPTPAASHSVGIVTSGALQDETWGTANGSGDEVIVVPKSDFGPGLTAPSLAVATGQGHSGGDCMAVTVDSGEFFGFFVLKRFYPGASNPSGTLKYLLPYGQRANRMSFWVKFPAGYRATNWDDDTVQNTNLHIGSYAALSSSGTATEDNNWHFYHEPTIRHADAGSGWVQVVCNESPHHIRSVNATGMAANPTQPHGRLWEMCTRFYIESKPYGLDPEISYPFTMLIDDIKLDYVVPTLTVTPEILGFATGDFMRVGSSTSNYTVRLTNTGNAAQAVTLYLGAMATYYTASLSETAVTVPAKGTYDVTLAISKTGSTPSVSDEYRIGINCVLTSELGTNNPSADTNVEQRKWSGFGPLDADSTGCHVFGVLV